MLKTLEDDNIKVNNKNKRLNVYTVGNSKIPIILEYFRVSVYWIYVFTTLSLFRYI